MCAVSAIIDYEIDRWSNNYNHFWDHPKKVDDLRGHYVPNNTYVINSGVTKEEFEAFSKEFLELKKLVQAALEFDKNSNQPHCEVDEKVAIVKKVAEQLGVSMEDVFPSE